jgi:cyanophycin synthetase
MSSFWLNRLTLEGLYGLELFRAFLHYRSPRRRKVRKHRLAFNERAWREAAAALGATFTPLGSDVSEIQLNGVCTRVSDYTSEIDSPVTNAMLHEKPLVHKLLQEQGLPVPRHAVFALKDIRPAVDFLLARDSDCVIKPANGTGGGRGVTTGIRDARHLAQASAAAAVYADELLIEEQIAGDNYRLLFLDGQLIDAFVRRPPGVVGDGRSTIAALVDSANRHRLETRAAVSQVLIHIDLDMQRTLAKQNLSMRSVPAVGTRIALKTVINDNSGSDNSSAMHLLESSIVEAGRRATQSLRVRLAGVDIITTDPSIPLSESGGVILEVNGTPGLYHHYQKSDGAFPVALHILRRLLLEDGAPRAGIQSDEFNQLEGTLA